MRAHAEVLALKSHGELHRRIYRAMLALTERGWQYGNTLPDRITLYQGPIEDASESDDDVVVCIGETLIHELGHYFGLSEDEIEEIEERYWRGDAEAD